MEAFVALIVLVCAVSRAVAAPVAAPAPCVWTPETNTSYSKCDVNPAFAANLQTTLAKNGSPYAKFTAQYQIAAAACGAHDASTPKGLKACVADTANQCYVTFVNGVVGCDSNLQNSGILPVVCPNSGYYNVTLCNSLNQTACAANKMCAISVLAGYGPKPSDLKAAEDAYKKATNSTGLEFEIYGSCQYKKQLDYATVNGSFSLKLYNDWASNTISSTNQAIFLSDLGRGNCTYAQNAYARIAQNQLCQTYNTISIPLSGTTSSVNSASAFGIAITNANPNTTAIFSASANNCVFVPSSKRSYNKATYGLDAEWISANWDVAWAYSTRLNPKMDGPYFTAYTTCPKQIYQYNKAACLGVTV